MKNLVSCIVLLLLVGCSGQSAKQTITHVYQPIAIATASTNSYVIVTTNKQVVYLETAMVLDKWTICKEVKLFDINKLNLK